MIHTGVATDVPGVPTMFDDSGSHRVIVALGRITPLAGRPAAGVRVGGA